MTLQTIVTDTQTDRHTHTHTDGQAHMYWRNLADSPKTTVLTTVTSLYVTGRYNTSLPSTTVTTYFRLVFRRKITGSRSVRSCDNRRAPVIKRLISFDRVARVNQGRLARSDMLPFQSRKRLTVSSSTDEIEGGETGTSSSVDGRKMVEVRVFVVRDPQTALGDVYFLNTGCDIILVGLVGLSFDTPYKLTC